MEEACPVDIPGDEAGQGPDTVDPHSLEEIQLQLQVQPAEQSIGSPIGQPIRWDPCYRQPGQSSVVTGPGHGNVVAALDVPDPVHHTPVQFLKAMSSKMLTVL